MMKMTTNSQRAQFFPLVIFQMIKVVMAKAPIANAMKADPGGKAR
jgi:hypothetical protein